MTFPGVSGLAIETIEGPNVDVILAQVDRLPAERFRAVEVVVAIADAHPQWTASELADHLSERYDLTKSKALSLVGQATSVLEARLRAWCIGRIVNRPRRPRDPSPWIENAVRALEDG